ncbi:hypothetical protein [Rhodococcus sp. NPDC057529]|uniref:hypothetical protein n=1 Tax=Rhodococcus sp. NPDC057529 TaxID=3346158 RepID=UPI00366A57AA
MITAIGPVRLPSIGEIRDTLTVLAHAGGRRTPIGLVPATESRRWEHRPQDFLGNVRQFGPCTREEVPRLLTRLARADASASPLNVAVAGDFLLLDISHGLGDGRLALALVRAVAGGRSGTPVPEWARTRDSALPLARALTRTFATSPARVAQLLEPRPSTTHEAGPVQTVPWCRSPTAVVESAVSGTTAELRRWRDRELPGASVSSLLFAAVARAMRSRGLTVDDKVDVLFDCRRYLPGSATVNGNFAAGVRFALSDPGDAAEMSAAIAQATASGRPLASLALSIAKFRRRMRAGTAHTETAHVAATPRVRLVYSDMGEAALLADLDWTDEPGRRIVTALSEPADPASIVFTSVRRGPELDVSASLHDNVFDPELVRDALADALCDPLSLLSRRIV